MKACIHCAEAIQDEAKVCRWCHRDIKPLFFLRRVKLPKIDPWDAIGAVAIGAVGVGIDIRWGIAWALLVPGALLLSMYLFAEIKPRL